MGVFFDRADAGERLAQLLDAGAGTIVLGIPRGGVVVAVEVARRIGAPLDVIVPRKLGAPTNPELGIGAVGPDGSVVLDERIVRVSGASPDYIEAETRGQLEEICRRTALYRRGRAPLDLAGRRVIVVDDGIATGGTAEAAVRSARNSGAAEVILAVPVAPPEAVRRLSEVADKVVVLYTPERFNAVGQWYLHFDQVSDDEVCKALRETARAAG